MGTVKNFMALRCEHCPLCNYARKNPETAFGKVMEWHGQWCPFWKAWQEKYGDGGGTDDQQAD
ncbi:hypothetical protein ACFL4G_08140 [Thermodesulfobacteriota bacterium]